MTWVPTPAPTVRRRGLLENNLPPEPSTPHRPVAFRILANSPTVVGLHWKRSTGDGLAGSMLPVSKPPSQKAPCSGQPFLASWMRVLSANNVWVRAELVVLACPKLMQQRFLFTPTTWTHPEVGVLGGPLGVPNVVCHNRSEGVGLIDLAVCQQAVVDGLCASEVGWLSVPKTAVGVM